MYKIILGILLLQNLTLFAASSEPSFFRELRQAEELLASGELHKSRENLLGLVQVSCAATREFNRRYALRVAELLFGTFEERAAAAKILSGIFSDKKALDDSSLYLKAAELYRRMGEPELSDELFNRGQNTSNAAWLGSGPYSKEDLDYDALGLRDPRQGF